MDGSDNMNKVEWIPDWVPRRPSNSMSALPDAQRDIGPRRRLSNPIKTQPLTIRKPVFFPPPDAHQNPKPKSKSMPNLNPTPESPESPELPTPPQDPFPDQSGRSKSIRVLQGMIDDIQTDSSIDYSDNEQVHTRTTGIMGTEDWSYNFQRATMIETSTFSSFGGMTDNIGGGYIPDDEGSLSTDSEDIDDIGFDYGDMDPLNEEQEDEGENWITARDLELDNDESEYTSDFDLETPADEPYMGITSISSYVSNPLAPARQTREDEPKLDFHWTSDMPMDVITYILLMEATLRLTHSSRTRTKYG